MSEFQEVVTVSTEPAVNGENSAENKFEANQVVLSLSGGLDSTCLLMYYLAQGKTVHAVSFRYGQKHAIELKKVQKNIKFLQKLSLPVDHQIVDLTSAFAMSASTLKADGGAIPEGNYADENMKSTVVENRNITFSSIVYGIALGIANRSGENIIISQGVHAGDHTIYPDCRPESVEMARELYRISNWGSERVDFETPFVNIHKGQVLQAGIDAMKKLGFNKPKIKKVLANTHTCYNPNEAGEACGKCGSCTERLEAFGFVGMEDPAPYQK
jgi:7-cyano-7-deazaguanine synthase